MSAPKSRRASFLEMGGRNSLSQFCSSYTRAQSFVGSTLLDAGDEISPCTLRLDDGPSLNGLASTNFKLILSTLNDARADAGGPSDLLAVDNDHSQNHTHGHNKAAAAAAGDHIANFQFPGEHTPLVKSARSGSVGSFASLGYSTDSTAPQTIFNAVNTLMGIAMLSLPYGFHLAGWAAGTMLLIACASATNATAKILGSILRRHRELATYGDIARSFGGPSFQGAATAIFMVDLLGAAVLLVLLFSDSFAILFPAPGSATFKVLVVSITFGLLFLPLAMVSLVSLTGILCTVALIVLIVTCGLMEHQAPGSLWQPAALHAWPASWQNLILSLGVFMAPWGGHPVFPELYRDMRHPQKYPHCCNVTFASTLVLDIAVATIGYAMYGDHCMDTLTKNIMTNTNYPLWVGPLLCTFLGLLPVLKLALIIRPIVSVYESHFRMNDHAVITYKNGRRVVPMTWTKFVARLALAGLLLVISLVFTSFGSVITFLGSAICFTICITFPLMFHLKLNASDLTPTTRAVTIFGIAVGMVGAVAGTYASVVFTAQS